CDGWARGCRLRLQMKNGEQLVGAERAKKNALFALLVVNCLTSDGKVHALRSFTQIVNLKRRPVFAETVGQNAVGAGTPVKIENRVAQRFHAAKALHFDA